LLLNNFVLLILQMGLLDQDWLVMRNQIEAVVGNLLSWALSFLPVRKQLTSGDGESDGGHRCWMIRRPGGFDQFDCVRLADDEATQGYNIEQKTPVTKIKALDPSHVVVDISHCSVNFADVTIRWGLYESALRFVGWPICPGFDISGKVSHAGSESGFQVGDEVFGATLFGGYSTRCVVPSNQLRKIPPSVSPKIAASIPAVAFTAIHSLALAGLLPATRSSNNFILIHSAAGGVGSTIARMAKLLGIDGLKVVGVIGRDSKREFAESSGCDYVVSKENNPRWWKSVFDISPSFRAIFDANGLSTIQASYDALCMTGKLVIFGFASNIPMASSYLNPISWMGMVWGMLRMPAFDPMKMTLESKSVLGFNLSFFASEHDLVNDYFEILIRWLNDGSLTFAVPRSFDFRDISAAHELIQSGRSAGKIVVNMN